MKISPVDRCSHGLQSGEDFRRRMIFIIGRHGKDSNGRQDCAKECWVRGVLADMMSPLEHLSIHGVASAQDRTLSRAGDVAR
jgi:hypothetical protein